MAAPQTPLGLSQRLALVLQTLRNMIAARAGRDRSAAGIVLLVWPYLHRVARRFEALVRRVQAGQAAIAPAKPRPARLSPHPRPPRPSPRLPQGFAWLVRLAPETAPLGGQLRHLLTDPEFFALLAADQRAGKILRPLCRMLGVRADPDLPPALFRPPAEASPPAKNPPARRWPPKPASSTEPGAQSGLPPSRVAPA